jgi:predicted aminopeptidase
LAAALAACSPAYVLSSWAGQRRLMSGRRPIDAVLADPATGSALRARLELARAARAFGRERMALPPSSNYADFVDVGRPFVTMIVSASPKTELRAYTWWFPVVGRVPYKGFFDEKGARAEADRLRRAGYDVHLGGARAYSTLGWWKDPLLSTMLDDSAGGLAETLLHELAHGAAYFPGQGDFNESLATYAGERGAEEFLAAHFGAQSPELRSYLKEREQAEREGERVEKLYRDLAALYGSAIPETEKLARREPLLEAARKDLDAIAGKPGAWPPLDNAVVLAARRYRTDLGAFRALHDSLGGDWGRFWERVRALDKRRPWESLARR